MCGEKQLLQFDFEIIFTVVALRIDFILDLIKTAKQVHGGLLIAGGRVLQVRLGGLQVEGVSVILQELERNGVVERHAD